MNKLIIILLILPILLLANPIYVETWPNQVKVDDGVAIRPTPEMCRAAGYELIANRPQAEIDAELSALETIKSNAIIKATERENKINAIRENYRTTTKALCREINITETNILYAVDIETIVNPIIDDADSTKNKNKILSLILKLEYLTRLLEKEDGVNALDNI
jgi:hypothetical protein